MYGVPIYNSIDQIMTVFDLLGRAKRIVIPKSIVGKVNSYKSMCAYLHVSSFILDIVVRYPELPCRSLGGLSFHVYPNIIIDNGTKSEHADKNINITEISSQLLINLL